MSRCTTWHVRIDIVDDGAEVHARAVLVGAPAAMIHQREPRHSRVGGSGVPDTEFSLTTWRPVEDLAQALVDTLTREHAARSG